MSGSFSARATVAASTKRKTLVSGMQGTPATNEAALYCWPLAPVDGETRTRNNLNTAFQWWQTFIEGDYDILNGDRLVIGAAEYEIERCEAWPWRDTTRFRLFVSELRR